MVDSGEYGLQDVEYLTEGRQGRSKMADLGPAFPEKKLLWE
jgi:hypothetical protein